jgi:heptosyltransferase-1
VSKLPVNEDRTHRLGPDIHRLLIVRLGAMGDIMIGWVIEERWAELLCTLATPRSGPRSMQRPLIDRIHTVNTASWRKAFFSLQTLQEIAAALSDLRAPAYEVAVDLQGALRSALIARWSGAPTIYGAAQPRENVASMFYTRTVIPHGAHVVEQNFSLAEAVAGSSLKMPAPIFPRDEAAEQECERTLQEQGIRQFVIVNPGAGWGAKRWPELRYGEVARELAKQGMRVLINCGPGEKNLALAVKDASGGTAESIAGSLTQLIALTRRAALFIGGDTGPMHLAAAFGIPVVAIFGPTNPARNGPFGTKSIVLRSPSSITSHVRHQQTEEGLLEITPAEVIVAARQLLGDTCG